MSDPFARDDEEVDSPEVEDTSEPAPSNVVSMAQPPAPPARRGRASVQAQQSAQQTQTKKDPPQLPPRRGHKGQTPDAKEFSTNEAELLWPEVMEKITAEGFSAFDLNFRVLIVEPGPKHMIGKWLDCSIIMGDQTEGPGDALQRIVTDYFHMPVARQSALYEVQFFWKSTGHLYARGILRLPNPSEIIAVRNATMQLNDIQAQPHNRPPPPMQQQQQQQQPQGYGAQPQQQPGFGGMPSPMPGYMPQTPQQQYVQQQQYPQQQPQQPQQPTQVHVAPGVGAESIEAMRAELGYLRGKLDQVLLQPTRGNDDVEDPELAAWRIEQRFNGPGFGGGGFGGAPAAPVAAAPVAPPQPPVDEDRIVNRILSALGARMHTFQPPPQYAAPPQQPQAPVAAAAPPVAAAPQPQYAPPPPPPAPAPAPPPHNPRADFRAFIRDQREQRAMMREFRTLLEDDDPEEEPTPVRTPPPPTVVSTPPVGSGLPFGVTAVPESRWSDGRQVNFAQDPKTGKIDLVGSAAANPIILERIIDGAGKLMAGLGDLAANAAKNPHVVAQTPPGTQDGTPAPGASDESATNPTPGTDGGWPTL